ncbi:trans-aconitate 2-methyltransferase [Conexibacter sp. CPCC 206217]|uniref:class I SAM-dependent methyltransferase n=1 Tax=Conexibacter sp. CPCC 206217 TaxID=3064574 RepID=UPI002726DC3A|nr:class I SAM-dependent methyltransferase [Conexibacter sp. CPCC 206217]MDO8210359.1 class I SAM-dependent methyltransferase [Conexibacter sp. CPCC 206217]
MAARSPGGSGAAAPAGPDSLLGRWDDQQAAYIADREGRFRAIVDVLRLTLGDAPLVLDLACGPGSLSARVLDALPGARVLGLDHDPLLLDVARRSLAGRREQRLTLLDADLLDGGWPAAVLDALGGAAPDAIVSTTALHWLRPDQLVRVYAQAASLLRRGGVLLNGDHFRFDARSPTLRGVAAAHDEETQRAAHAAGAPTWDAWWDEARSGPGGAALAAERERRFAGRDAPPTTAVDFHLAALAQAGFAETGTVWQLLDDYVVFGRR